MIYARTVGRMNVPKLSGEAWEGKMNCPKCKSKNLTIIESGLHQKLVCADCLAFVKFLSKAAAKTFKQLQCQAKKA
jgi:transposase-like protein